MKDSCVGMGIRVLSCCGFTVAGSVISWYKTKLVFSLSFVNQLKRRVMLRIWTRWPEFVWASTIKVFLCSVLVGVPESGAVPLGPPVPITPTPNARQTTPRQSILRPGKVHFSQQITM